VGREWAVREIGAPAYDRRTRPSLLFERDDVIRRVRLYPADWFTLSDEALYAVSLGR
jgi:hypothetical protein